MDRRHLYSRRLYHMPDLAKLGPPGQCQCAVAAWGIDTHAISQPCKQYPDRYLVYIQSPHVKSAKPIMQDKLLSSHAAGVLPAFLPQAFEHANTGACWLSVVYLSNNSISGSLPPVWADASDGWRESLQRLYLSDNQITGQLPQLWSDSNSLWKLSRLDLFGNQMTGTIPWDLAKLPSLHNLVLLPGVPLHLKQLTLVALHQLSGATCSLCSICSMLPMYISRTQCPGFGSRRF